jgi:hypothetical protein
LYHIAVISPRPILRYALATLCAAVVARADAPKKNPTSKLYVADAVGENQIDTGVEIDDLTKKSVYNAEGTVVETKAHSNTAVVLSNGTGIYVDVNTRLHIKDFEQEALRPNRSDMDDEPSISRTHLYIEKGVIGVSTSKLVAGSTMVYDTPLASAEIRGRQAVILSEDNLTVISMVQGEATVQAGPLDRPRLLKNHQQIIIRPGKPGEANIVEIQDIPDGADEDALVWLEERVITADNARKMVYFEVAARKAGDNSVTVFDAASNDASGRGTGSSGNEIVAVPVLPVNPTVQPNVSPANLISR